MRSTCSPTVQLMAGGLALVLAGCGAPGNLTDTVDTVDDRDLSGVAGPSDASALQPAARLPRASFATANTVESLAYPGLDDQEREVFTSALTFFITEHTAEEG